MAARRARVIGQLSVGFRAIVVIDSGRVCAGRYRPVSVHFLPHDTQNRLPQSRTSLLIRPTRTDTRRGARNSVEDGRAAGRSERVSKV